MTTTRPSAKLIRKAARTITTSPACLDRLNWLRDNAPEISAYIEDEAKTLIHSTAADYPRVAMQRFSMLVMYPNGR